MKDYTEEELLLMLANKTAGTDINVDEKRDKVLFKELKAMEGLVDYLKETAARDIRRYFEAATDAERLMIRGTYARTMYLRAKIVEGGEKKTKIDEVNYN